MLMIVLYMATGLVSGLCSGVLGVGGGIIIVPALLWIFQAQGLGLETAHLYALGTSLACIIGSSSVSTCRHHQKGAVDWAVFKKMAWVLVVCTLLGSLVAPYLGGRILQILFALYAASIGVGMLYPRQRIGRVLHLSQASYVLVAALIGAISSLVGIGGGSMSVPFLLKTGKSMPQSIATSAALGLPIAVGGTLGFYWAGRHGAGWIDWQAAFWIVLASLFSVPLGVRFAHQLPQQYLKQGFGLLLCMIALKMVF